MGRRSDHSREEISQMALRAAKALVAHEGLKGLTASADRHGRLKADAVSPR